jgi:quercetin dioxygenase-like cupin family protein
MKREISMPALALFVGVALGALGHDAVSAQQPPVGAKGLAARTLASLDLGPEIPGLQGRYLRARVVTAEPGGHSAVHSHQDRPAIPYVLKGTLTQCTLDGACRELHEGQAGTAGKEIVHWDENKGTTPLIYLVLDISGEP